MAPDHDSPEGMAAGVRSGVGEMTPVRFSEFYKNVYHLVWWHEMHGTWPEDKDKYGWAVRRTAEIFIQEVAEKEGE